jgi:hypothetical protein
MMFLHLFSSDYNLWRIRSHLHAPVLALLNKIKSAKIKVRGECERRLGKLEGSGERSDVILCHVFRSRAKRSGIMGTMVLTYLSSEDCLPKVKDERYKSTKYIRWVGDGHNITTGDTLYLSFDWQEKRRNISN